MKKRLLCLALALVFCLTLLPAGAAAEGASGNWAEESYRDTSWGSDYSTASAFTVSDEGDLAQFAALANDGKDFDGKTVTLAADLDLSAHCWTPIDYFIGTFDGGGHTITGLYVDASGGRTGMFNTVGTGAVVKDLTLHDSFVRFTQTNGNYDVGGFAGYNGGTIQNCRVTGNSTVTGYTSVGGIAGYNTGTIQNCESACNVTGRSGNNQDFGGIVGENQGVIQDCKNTGVISNAAFIGGIAGMNNGTVQNCNNAGEISASKFNASSGGLYSYAGGVAGLNYSILASCTNTGKVTGDGNRVGGVVGENSYKSTKVSVANCANTGNVTGNSAVGGVAGYSSETVEFCYSTGAVTANNGTAGGVVGENDSGSVQSCRYLTGTADTGIGASSDDENAAPLTADQFKDAESVAANFPGWDFGVIWKMGETRPLLRAGTEDDPFEPAVWSQLCEALQLGGYVKLAGDVTYNTGDGAHKSDDLAVPAGVDAVLDLNGHVVDRGLTEVNEFNGCAISVGDNFGSGSLTLNDSDPDAKHPGKTYIDPITEEAIALPAGGVITGGYDFQYGSGVCVLQSSTFTMNGGSIVGNSVGKNALFGEEGLGAGVYVQNGSFTMNGGLIAGNRAVNKISMNGGWIGKGGGVFVANGTLELNGGTITGNEACVDGGGVYVKSASSSGSGTLKVSGGATVTGNLAVIPATETDPETRTDNNVYLEGGGSIQVTDPLTGTEQIGVTMEDPGVFTGGLSGKGAAANFTSDDPAYYVAIESGEARLSDANVVEVIPGENMTKTDASGETVQSLEPGTAMTEVVYTASDGFYFPENYAAAYSVENSGVAVTRDSVGQITVSGTPTADVTVTLPDATAKTKPNAPAGLDKTDCTTADNNDGSITGVDQTMEYRKNGDEAWTKITDGSVAGLTPGGYSVRIRATDTTLASDPVTVTIAAYVPPSGGTVTAYKINPPAATDNGAVTVAPQKAVRGESVTITAAPDEGYRVDSVTVTDKNGNPVAVTDNGDGIYTFRMPASPVTVAASFAPAETPPEPAPAADDGQFVDVPAGAWYHDSVYWAVEKGITQGTDATHFSPKAPCTRGQMVTFLWRAAGEPAPADNGNPFTDVSGDDYFYSAVMWAVEKGITQGISPTAFSPNATVDRAQTVTFLYRYEQSEGGGFAGEWSFPLNWADAEDVPEWAYEAFCWMTMKNVVQGSGGKLLPLANCTRAEIVTMLDRYFGAEA